MLRLRDTKKKALEFIYSHPTLALCMLLSEQTLFEVVLSLTYPLGEFIVIVHFTSNFLA